MSGHCASNRGIARCCSWCSMGEFDHTSSCFGSQFVYPHEIDHHLACVAGIGHRRFDRTIFKPSTAGRVNNLHFSLEEQRAWSLRLQPSACNYSLSALNILDHFLSRASSCNCISLPLYFPFSSPPVYIVMAFDGVDSARDHGLFKTIAGGGRGPRVITFSSFGSPTGGYQGIYRTRGRFFQTPMVVGAEQKISMQALPLPVQGAIGWGVEPVGLLFDRDEAQTVISSFASYYNGLDGAKFPEDLQDRLYHMTAGHPGALTSLEIGRAHV